MTNRNTSGKEVTSLPLMKGTILILVLLFIFLAVLFFQRVSSGVETLPFGRVWFQLFQRVPVNSAARRVWR